MNILFLNSMKVNEFGGGEKWMIAAAGGLQERDHNVWIGCKSKSKLNAEAQKQNIPTINVDIRSDFSIKKSLDIARLIDHHNIRILICNFNKDLRVGGLAAKLAKTRPLVVARHGVLLCKKELKHRLTLTLLADAIITNTRSIQETYYSYGWFHNDFIKVIYNGIDIPEKVQTVDLKKKYPGKKIIFAAGRLTSQKGFDYLLQTMALLIKRRSDLVCLIAGEGELFSVLNQTIRSSTLQESVHLLGYQQDIYPYLSAADLVVLSSIHEGMPNILMEAMALGKAVLATRVNGVPELVVDGVSGNIIPPKNPPEMARAIEKMIDDPDQLLAFGKRGRERIKQNFTSQKMIDSIEQFLIGRLNNPVRRKKSRSWLKAAIKTFSLFVLKQFGKRPLPVGQIDTTTVRSVVILAQERYGDIILMTPLISGLKQTFPHLHITVVGVSRPLHILQNNPHIDELYDLKHMSWRNRARFFRNKFDLLFNTKDHPSVTLLYLVQRIRAVTKVGIYHPKHVGFYHHLIVLNEMQPRVEKNYSLMEFLGKPGWRPALRPSIYPGEMPEHIIQFSRKISAKTVVAVNLSTSRSDRFFPFQKWCDLIEKLRIPIIIFAMPGHYQDKSRLETQFADIMVAPNTRSIFEAAALLKHVDLLISPDTALIHLAAAFNIPVVGLYLSEIESKRFPPLSEKNVLILAKDNDMDTISTESILRAVRSILGNV